MPEIATKVALSGRLFFFAWEGEMLEKLHTLVLLVASCDFSLLRRSLLFSRLKKQLRGKM